MKDQTSIPQITKDTEERKVYGWNWTGDLETGETILTSEWSIETTETSPPTMIVPGSDTISSDDTAVLLEDGTVGVLYKLKNKVTTTPSSHVGVRRIEIRIVPK